MAPDGTLVRLRKRALFDARGREGVREEPFVYGLRGREPGPLQRDRARGERERRRGRQPALAWGFRGPHARDGHVWAKAPRRASTARPGPGAAADSRLQTAASAPCSASRARSGVVVQLDRKRAGVALRKPQRRPEGELPNRWCLRAGAGEDLAKRLDLPHGPVAEEAERDVQGVGIEQPRLVGRQRSRFPAPAGRAPAVKGHREIARRGARPGANARGGCARPTEQPRRVASAGRSSATNSRASAPRVMPMMIATAGASGAGRTAPADNVSLSSSNRPAGTPADVRPAPPLGRIRIRGEEVHDPESLRVPAKSR